METIACDPYLDPSQEDVEMVDLDELLSRSHVVSVHCPFTDETRELFDAETFAKMQARARRSSTPPAAAS